MAQNLTYNLTINGNPYTLVLTDAGHLKKEVLSINGEVCKDFPKPTWKDGFIGRDRIINIEGKEVHMVKMGNTTEFALDGFYMESGLQYIPSPGVPGWGWIFIVLSATLLARGAIGGGLGGLSAFFCLKLITNTRETNTAKKIAICTGIVAGSWVAFWVLSSLFRALVSG